MQTKSTLVIVELNAIVEQRPEVLQLGPDNPLYTDLEKLKERKNRGELEFVSHDEVWSDELPQIQ